MVVVIAVLVVLNWESLSIMLTNRELQGPVEAVPEAADPGSQRMVPGEIFINYLDHIGIFIF